jgi:AraC-like DNA-binding protein
MPALPSTQPVAHDQPDAPTPLRRWIQACRAALDRCPPNAMTVAAVLDGQIASMPPSLSAREKEVARNVLHDTCRRIVDLVLGDPTAIAAPDLAAGPVLGTVADARVVRAMTAIDERFADPGLRLRDLARELAVSDCRLTQLLKDATGRSFGAHVHARRVAHARVLLGDSTLSVKEVAARVGYSTTTQLDRHFKKVVGRLPSECRVTACRSHSLVASADGKCEPAPQAQVSLTQQQN